MCWVRGSKRQNRADGGSGQGTCSCHLNTLSSVWYGIFITAFQAYIATRNTASLLEWNSTGWDELKGAWSCLGAAVLLLPLFLGVSLFKVGNLANDGYKLGRSLSTCQADPKDPLVPAQGFSLLFRHGGPTAPFLHIVIAFCLLIPKLLIQPKLMEAGYIPKDNIWKTDLDFVLSSYDRLVVLSFMTPPPTENGTLLKATTTGATATTGVASSVVSAPSPTAQTLTLLSNPSLPMTEEEKWGPVSIEFFNYALALSVYAVRYPAVFWNTNKYWGALFSFQLFVNAIQILLIYTGVCILYKVHVIGPTELFTSLPARFGKSFFLLNPHVTLALFVLTTALVLSSSLVLYLYGYGRFNAFLNHEKACKVISVEGKEWGYLTHCTALCVLLAITVVEGPLLIDLAVIYKSTFDSSVLLCVIGIVFHLFIWVVLWLGLTLKQNWEFKLRVTVGKVAVRSARSIKLLTDVELVSSCELSAPLLVVASGRTYTVCDTSPKKTIIGAIHKAAMERKAKLQANAGTREQIEENDEQIYWLRPKPMSPKNSPDSVASDRVTWYRKQSKPKVTFNKNVKKLSQEESVLRDDDEGDYARLRESPMMNDGCGMPPENQQQHMAKVQNQRNSSISQRDYEEPSPLYTPDPMELPPPPPCESDKPIPSTPRCLRRADSGMPNDLTPRSDSEASASPPDNSETSSGVHSNSSRESNNPGVVRSLDCNDEGNKHQCAQWNGTKSTGSDSDPESKVYIKRRVESETIPLASSPQDHFGRSTNMRMISFTDCQPSATLPHFPTQQVGMPYPQCSTMPLPPVANSPVMHAPTHVNYPRHHTTIPTHHNGVRLFNSNIYSKRFVVHRYPQQHHSFPLLMNQNNKVNFQGNGDPANNAHFNQNKLNYRINGEIETSNYSVITNEVNDFQT